MFSKWGVQLSLLQVNFNVLVVPILPVSRIQVIFTLSSKHLASVFFKKRPSENCKVIVRAGAIGALAPFEIEQRVPGIHSDMGQGL